MNKNTNILNLFKTIIEQKNKIIEYYYNNKEIDLGIDKITGMKFSIDIKNKTLFIVGQHAIINKLLNNLLNKLTQFYIVIMIDWYSKLLNKNELAEINYKEIINNTIENLNKFIESYDDLYEIMTLFTQILIEIYNLTKDEAILLKRILLENFKIKYNNEIILKNVINDLKETVFKTSYENEIKYSLIRKLEEMINNKIINEIRFKTKGDLNEKFYNISLGIINNIGLKILILLFIFNKLNKIFRMYNAILILYLPTIIFRYLEMPRNMQLMDQLISILKEKGTTIIITENLAELPPEIKIFGDYILISKEELKLIEEGLNNKELTERVKEIANYSSGELIIIDKDFTVFSIDIPSTTFNLSKDDIIFE